LVLRCDRGGAEIIARPPLPQGKDTEIEIGAALRRERSDDPRWRSEEELVFELPAERAAANAPSAVKSS